jgi:hypothetical protein
MPDLRSGVPVSGLRAALFVPETKWDRRRPLELYVALVNESNHLITVDRSLLLGWTLGVNIKRRSGLLTYQTSHARISKPTAAGLVQLRPGELLGRKLVISTSSRDTPKELRKALQGLPRGTVALQLEYRATDYAWDWQSGKPPWWTGTVASNWVPIQVQ